MVFVGSSIDRFTVLDNAPAMGFKCAWCNKNHESNQSDPACLSPLVASKPQHALNGAKCVNVTILYLHEAWGSFPYGPVKYVNPVKNGIDAFVPGLGSRATRHAARLHGALSLSDEPQVDSTGSVIDSCREVFVFWRVNKHFSTNCW
jgi:hypothetical protein